MAVKREAPALTRVSYLPDADRFLLGFESGIELSVPRSLVPGFEHATPGQLLSPEILGCGTAVYWEAADEGFDAREAIAEWFAMRSFVAQMAGSARTPAKVAAVRENGRKGGRPRRTIAT